MCLSLFIFNKSHFLIWFQNQDVDSMYGLWWKIFREVEKDQQMNICVDIYFEYENFQDFMLYV
jgi:hypothetical protein